MSLDVERALLMRMLTESDMRPVHEKGIRPNVLHDPDNRSVLETMIRQSNEYSQVPTLEMVLHDRPDLASKSGWSNGKPGKHSMDWLVREVRRNHALWVLEDALEDAVVYFREEDDDEVRKIFRDTLAQLEAELPNARDFNVKGSGEQRIEGYREINSEEVRGIECGFRVIDLATGGLKGGQLVTVVGPPKAGKSTAMLWIALNAHNQIITVEEEDVRVNPLVIGFEMSNEEQIQRLDAIAAEVSHRKLVRGELTEEEHKQLRRSIRAMDHGEDFIFTNDITSTLTLSGIAAKIDQHRPRLLIVDGVYMMQDENGEPPGSPQALTNITRGFKRMAQNLDIPIVITTQVLEWKMDKKRGIVSNSIGYSSSFAQDSDVIIGVERVPDEPSINKIKIVLARNAPMGVEMRVRWDWDSGTFEEIEDTNLEDGGDDDPRRGW